KAQNMFRTAATPDPEFSDVIELDLASVVPSLAGPKRPQARIELTNMKQNFNDIIRTPIDKGGYGLSDEKIAETVKGKHTDGSTREMGTGAVVIAAITSCTNTSNPSVMLGAGLLAKKAVERGLTKPGYVKSSLT
ncbi:aconitate hydratase, partial [Clostridium perfringens]